AMLRKLTLVLGAFALIPSLAHSQDSKTVLDGVTKALGDVKSLQYTGSGANFSFGQNVTPTAPWPKFNLKTFTRTINYETPAMRDEFVRSQADPTARGGGGIPLTGEQRQMQAVSGSYAWSQTEQNPLNPAMTAVGERLHQLWITPHGIIKIAAKHNAS